MKWESIQTYLDKGDIVRIEGNKRIEVLLLDIFNYARFKGEEQYTFCGGTVEESPYDIQVPKTGKWYIVIKSDEEIGNIRDYIKIIK